MIIHYTGFPYGEGKYTYPDGGYYKGEFRNLLHVNKFRAAFMEGLNRIPQCDGLRHGFGMVIEMLLLMMMMIMMIIIIISYNDNDGDDSC
jgi:hypothetical protein